MFGTMKINLIVAVAAVALIFTGMHAAERTISSPDGKLCATLSDEGGGLALSLRYADKVLLNPSPVGLEIDGAKPSRIGKTSVRKNISETVVAPFYRQNSFSVTYNRMNVNLKNGQSVELRVFNEGMAYRFALDGAACITDETADYNLPADVRLYLSHSTNDKDPLAMAFQNTYSCTPVGSASPQLAFLPACVDYSGGLKLTITESDLEAYPGMFLQADSVSGRLSAVFAAYPKAYDRYPWRQQLYVTERENFIARTDAPRTLPWRVLAVTTDDRKLPVNNLVYALARPNAIGQTDWIRPGKVAWDWWNDWGLRGVDFKAGINTETYRHFIDFAAENGLEYVVLDEGWYDPRSGDMLTVIPEIDLHGLVAYGKERGVDLVLWTVFNVLDEQLAEACRRYADMGIAGFKVDFLDRDDQQAVEMAYRIAREAAANHLILDYHGYFKPTGINRTYPNILNFEGVFGMEEVRWTDIDKNMPLYDVTFPYLRMMAGPVDFTPGAMRNAAKNAWKAIYTEPMSMGTRAHQVALYVVHDSPFTMLADSPSNYRDNRPTLEFISSIPTVFDETRILSGTMGESIVTARRAGSRWFIGGLTNWDERTVPVSFDFLPEGVTFEVELFADGPNANRIASDHKLTKTRVNSTSRMDVPMASGGGFAMKLRPTL